MSVTSPDYTPSQISEELLQTFPAVAFLINTWPELRDLFIRAEANGWGPDEFQQQLWQTSWWRTRSANARDYDALRQTDPAEAQRQDEQQAALIESNAIRLGVRLNQADLDELVQTSLRWGYSDQELQNAIIDLGEEVGSTAVTGTIQVTTDDLIKLARQYMVNLSPENAHTYATQIERGNLTVDGVESLFRDQAKAAFPHLISQLEDGYNLYDITSNIRGKVASLLEISPEMIDLTSEKWSGLMDGYTNTDGTLRLPTYAEAAQFAREQPEWAGTDNAKKVGASITRTLLSELGVVKW